jgi:ankyrin repeat protein
MAKNLGSPDHQALHQAIRNYDVVTVRAMLGAGISPETAVEGLTPLFVAARCGHSGIVDLLLDAGANPNRRMKGTGDAALRTALNAAAYIGDVRSVSKLLAAGANPSSLDAAQQTAAHLLITGDPAMGNRYANSSDSWRFEMYGSLNRMLDKGIQINQPDKKGRTLLHCAITEKAPKLLVDTLLRRGADPTYPALDGLSPFHYACKGGRVEHYQMLIRHGVKLDGVTVDGRTPLHICDDEHNFEQIMATKPDLEARDHEGRTALADALHDWSGSAWTGKVMRLIAAGADIDAADYDGNTPRDIIKRKKIPEVTAFVAAHEARVNMSRIASTRHAPFGLPWPR